MTVSSSTDRATFAGNGVATAFPLPFRFFANSDLIAQAIVDATGQTMPLTLGIDYALTGAGQPEEAGAATGVLTTSAPVPAGVSLFVQRIIPATQPTDIVNQGRFFPEVHETVFDRLTMLVQQNEGAVSRALRVQDFDPIPARLPPAEQRALKVMSFDAEGNPVAVDPVFESALALRQDLANTEDPSKGGGMVFYGPGITYPAGSMGEVAVLSAFSVPSVFALLSAFKATNKLFIARGYLPGQLDGGGSFVWDPSAQKTNHDGRNFISPTVPWDGLAGTLPAFLSGTGETDPGGAGCWVRMIESHEVEVDSYGGVTAATLNRAVLDLDTGNAIYTGGQAVIPVGQHSVTDTVNVNNGSAFDIQGVTLRGRGKQASTLDFTGQPAGQNGIDFLTPIFAGMEDMGVRNSATSGIKLTGQPTVPGAISWNHFNMDRVRSSFNGKDGVEADRGFMGHFNQVFASHNAQNGFRFSGLHTSLLLSNCYAASNAQSGFAIEEPTYSVLNACAADNNGIYGYVVTKAAGTVINGCGSESNARSGFAALSSTANGENKAISLNGFFAFNNNTGNAGFPNAIYIKADNSIPSVVIARGCRSFSPANPTVDALVDGVGAYLVDEYNDFPNGVSSSNGGYIHHVAKTHIVRSLSVAAATNVIELQSTQGGQSSYSGELLITASNQQPSSSRNGNMATYKLLIHKDAAGVSVVEMSKIGQTTGAGASAPSFSWSMSGNFLRATPIGSTSAVFFFEIFSQGGLKVK